MATHTITLDHLEKAAKWAIRARKSEKALKIDGTKREFNMRDWDCGTSCCLAGAAAMEAGFSPNYHEDRGSLAGIAGDSLACALEFIGSDDGYNEIDDTVKITGIESHNHVMISMLNRIGETFFMGDYEAPERLLEQIKSIRQYCKNKRIKTPAFKVKAMKSDLGL